MSLYWSKLKWRGLPVASSYLLPFFDNYCFHLHNFARSFVPYTNSQPGKLDMFGRGGYGWRSLVVGAGGTK